MTGSSRSQCTVTVGDAEVTFRREGNSVSASYGDTLVGPWLLRSHRRDRFGLTMFAFEFGRPTSSDYPGLPITGGDEVVDMLGEWISAEHPCADFPRQKKAATMFAKAFPGIESVEVETEPVPGAPDDAHPAITRVYLTYGERTYVFTREGVVWAQDESDRVVELGDGEILAVVGREDALAVVEGVARVTWAYGFTPVGD